MSEDLIGVPNFGSSEPRQDVGDYAATVSRGRELTEDRLRGRTEIVALARETYAVLVENGATYRAFGACRDTEGDFVAAWVSWHEAGNEGPPWPHSDAIRQIHADRVAERTTKARAARVSRYYTPDGVPRTRHAPMGKGGQRVSGFRPTGAIQDKGRFAPVNRREVRWDGKAKSLSPLPDDRAPVYYSEEGARKADARCAEGIARYLDGRASRVPPYTPTPSPVITNGDTYEARIARLLALQAATLAKDEERAAIMRQAA
jgi:hypothetical protein